MLHLMLLKQKENFNFFQSVIILLCVIVCLQKYIYFTFELVTEAAESAQLNIVEVPVNRKSHLILTVCNFMPLF